MVSLVVKMNHDRKMTTWSLSEKKLALSLRLQTVKILLKKYKPLPHLRCAPFRFFQCFLFLS